MTIVGRPLVVLISVNLGQSKIARNLFKKRGGEIDEVKHKILWSNRNP